MIDQQPRDATLFGLGEQRPYFADVEMSGREHRVIGGDLVEDLLDLVLERAALIDDSEHRRRQHRILGRQELPAVRMADMVRRREGRHPHQPCAELETMFDGIGIEPAGGVVERYAGQ